MRISNTFLTLLSIQYISLGEVVFDGSLGTAGSAPRGGDVFAIPESFGERVGPNVFHSFEQLTLQSGEEARFFGGAADNVIARVTGGSISEIYGKIESSHAGADFYLINPAGIVIGKGAEIDVRGAFHLSTADYLRLGEGEESVLFFANTNVSLSAAPPEAFGFLSEQETGAIVVSDADLTADLTGFSLIGRNVEIQGSSMRALGAGIEVVAVGEGPAEFGGSSLSDLGGQISIDATEMDFGGGSLSLQGGNIEVSGGSQLSGDNRTDIFPETRIELLGRDSVTIRGESDIRALGADGGDGGDILVQTNSLVLSEGGQLKTGTFGTGDGGRIEVQADRVLLLGREDGEVGQQTRLSAQSNNGATGNAGVIVLEVTEELRLENGGVIVVESFGRGATATDSGEAALAIRAGSLWLGGEDLSSTSRISVGSNYRPGILDFGYGDGGDLNITIDGPATLLNGGIIETSTDSDANAGILSFQADSLLARGGTSSPFTGLLSFSRLRGVGTRGGRGGDIRVTIGDGDPYTGGWDGVSDLAVAPSGAIILDQGGLIDASTFGAGNAGLIQIESGGFWANRGSSDFFTGVGTDTTGFPERMFDFLQYELRSEANGTTSEAIVLVEPRPVGVEGGQGGEVCVHINGGELVLVGGATISSSTAGGGDAGNISVRADRLRISGGGSNSSLVPTAASGIIALAQEGVGSQGNGGDVVFLGRQVEITNRGLISAEALNGQQGGDVVILLGDRVPIANCQSERFDGPGVLQGGSLVLNSGASVSARGAGGGEAGSIFLTTSALELNDSALESSSVRGNGGESGDAGSVEVRGSIISLSEASQIGVFSEDGDAGRLSLEIESRLEITGSSLLANAGQDGGEILLEGGQFLLVRDGRVIAEAVGNGGDLNLRNVRFVIANSSLFSANAVNGNGGRIEISSVVFLANETEITASSEFGANGVVSVNPEISLNDRAVENEGDPLDPSDELQEECTKSLATEAGSFIVAGKGGTKRLPGGLSCLQ